MPRVDASGAIVLPADNSAAPSAAHEFAPVSPAAAAVHPSFNAIARPLAVSAPPSSSFYSHQAVDQQQLLASTASLDLESMASQAHSGLAGPSGLHDLSNVGSGVAYLSTQYVEQIQTFFNENHATIGRAVNVASLRLVDVFSLLQERVQAQKELLTQVLSLEFQNSQLADHVRSDEAYMEQQEKLHSLQLLERGILLRELSQQLNALRAEERTRVALSLRKNTLSKRVKGIKPGPGEASDRDREGALLPRVHLSLPHLVADARGDSAPPSAVQQATERMLASSVSMPILSDEYTPFDARGRQHGQGQGQGHRAREGAPGSAGAGAVSSSLNALSRPSTSAARATTASSPSRPSTQPGKPGSPTRRDDDKDKPLSAFLRSTLPPPARGPSPEAQTQRRIANTSFAPDVPSFTDADKAVLSQEKLAELKLIRKQIVSLVAQRYPRKKPPHRLATSVSKLESLDGRVLTLSSSPKK